MKRTIFIIIIFCTLIFPSYMVLGKQMKVLSSPNTYKVVNVYVYINSEKLSGQIKSIIVDNHTMIEALPIFKKLGGKVKWNPYIKRLDLRFNNEKFVLYVNKRVVFAGNKRLSLDVSPKIINGTPLVSLGFIEKSTGWKTELDSKNNFIYINKANPQSSTYTVNIPKILSNSSKKIVVIDPGHGGKESGAIYGGINEKDLNLDVALRLNTLLKKRGIKTFMTRTTDKTLTLKVRSDLANSVNASLLISVHHNALPNDRLYSGTETLFHPLSNSRGKVNGKLLAQITQRELVSRLGTTDRGVISRPELSVLRHSEMPSIIAEIGYMTNTKERNKLKNSIFKQKAAQALYSGVIKALNEME